MIPAGAIAPALIAALIVMVFLAITWTKPKGSRRVGRRGAKVAARWRPERTGMERSHNIRRDAPRGGLEAMMRQFVPRADDIRLRLTAASLRPNVASYAAFCFAAIPLLAAILQLLGISIWASLPLAAILGPLLPRLYVSRRIRKRRAAFLERFPDAIGLIVRGLKSGLPVTEAMLVAGRETADPAGEEFRRISDRLRIGQTMEQALTEAARRIDAAEFNFMVVTLAIQRETGGNLAETLENLDEVLRQRRQMRLKIRAMASQAKASAYIIGSLPFAMFALLLAVNASYPMLLLTTSGGNILLAIGVTMMGIGFFVISRMIHFEI